MYWRAIRCDGCFMQSAICVCLCSNHQTCYLRSCFSNWNKSTLMVFRLWLSSIDDYFLCRWSVYFVVCVWSFRISNGFCVRENFKCKISLALFKVIDKWWRKLWCWLVQSSQISFEKPCGTFICLNINDWIGWMGVGIPPTGSRTDRNSSVDLNNSLKLSKFITKSNNLETSAVFISICVKAFRQRNVLNSVKLHWIDTQLRLYFMRTNIQTASKLTDTYDSMGL